MSKMERVPGFGPSDPTDSRALLHWQSRYPPNATEEINREACYLGILLFLAPLLLFILFCRVPQFAWVGLTPLCQEAVRRYGIAWVSGMLGGTLFALKWLYHVVAKGLWNLDRRLWRLSTPHLSGGLAFAVSALVASGLLRIFDANAMHSISVVAGLSFLVGYFSDSAVAKLTEISDTLFGTSRSKEKHVPEFAQEAGPSAPESQGLESGSDLDSGNSTDRGD